MAKFDWSRAAATGLGTLSKYLIDNANADNQAKRDIARDTNREEIQNQGAIERQKMMIEAQKAEKEQAYQRSVSEAIGASLYDNIAKTPNAATFTANTGKPATPDMFENGLQPGGDPVDAYDAMYRSTMATVDKINAQHPDRKPLDPNAVFVGLLESQGQRKKAAREMQQFLFKKNFEANTDRNTHRENAGVDVSASRQKKEDEAAISIQQQAKEINLGLKPDPTKEKPGSEKYYPGVSQAASAIKTEEMKQRAMALSGLDAKGNPLDTAGKTWWNPTTWGNKGDQVSAANTTADALSRVYQNMIAEGTQKPEGQQQRSLKVIPGKIPPGARTKAKGKYWTLDENTYYDTASGQRVQ